MIRVGLVHTKPSYEGLAPPFGPGVAYPEFAHWGDPDAGASPDNHVYSAVREALHALGLDEARFGQADWNPLGQFVDAGSKVVLKPNFIRHWNPLEGGDENASLESVVTHGAVLRAMADYAFLAAGQSGDVIVAEAPQQDCDFEKIRIYAGLDELAAHAERVGHKFTVIDLRRETV
ncbi:MAG: hypothetical protein VCB43_07630, partial [Myxococcota bacterium]